VSPIVGDTLTAPSRLRIRFKLWHIVTVVAFTALYLGLLRSEIFILLQCIVLGIAIVLALPVSFLLFCVYLQTKHERARNSRLDRGIVWITPHDEDCGNGIRWLESETRR
jgi:hypothetical protein